MIEPVDRGLDDAIFFIAESAVFTRVGIEASHGDARVGNATAPQEICSEQADAGDAIGCQQAGDFGDGFVDGC